MIAARDLKNAARVGEDALFNVFDPGPVHAHRNLVLRLARHRTCVTSNAFAIIDYKAVFHPPKRPPPRVKQSYLEAARKYARNLDSEVVLGGARKRERANQTGSGVPKREEQT